MGESVVQRAFAGGELAPALHARADLAKYQQGARTIRNFLIHKEGGAGNRGGTRYIDPCKTNSATVRIFPYVSEVEGESVLVEQGVGYLRFFLNGAPLSVVIAELDTWDVATNYAQGDVLAFGGAAFYAKQAHTGHATSDPDYWHPLTGTIYEVFTPFTHEMNWVQSGRTITLTHKDEPPHDLVQLAPDRWVLLPVDTVPDIGTPQNLVVTPGGAGALTVAYVVTAIDEDTFEESEASAQNISGATAVPTTDDPHVLAWDAVTGAEDYAVYKDPYGNGVYGYLGLAAGQLTFNDTGLEPDFAITPPVAQTALFAATDGYPHTCTYYQQRRIFGYTNDQPEGIWGSRTGYPSNFGISTPLQDDDAINFRIVGNTHNPVRHLIGLKALIALTGGGEWTVQGSENRALTPSAIDAEQQAYIGAADVRPVAVGNSVIYVQARGRYPRDLQFDQAIEGLAGRDLGMFASHLFKGYTLKALAYQHDPDSIVWAVRSDGTLLGLTYIREQEVWGWHRHDTAGGFFDDVAVVPELAEDAVYVIVRRTVNGATVRYIERLMGRPLDSDDSSAWIFLDSSLSYDGAPVSNVSGMAHLRGLTVGVLADGVPLATRVMPAGGTITLGASYSTVHVGLPIVADLETLDLDVQGSAVRDKAKRVSHVTLLLEASGRGYLVGPDAAHLTRNVPPSWDTAMPATGLELTVPVSEWGTNGRVFIRQDQPLPLTILGIIPSVVIGG